MMGFFAGLDYWRFVEISDRMSWDAYPQLRSWRQAWARDDPRPLPDDEGRAALHADGVDAVQHELAADASLKKPGQHRQEMLIAIGHGADTAMYFQWRKSRGAFEKTHGAVVDHEGSERTRVFQEVAALGAELGSSTTSSARRCGRRSRSSTTGSCAGRSATRWGRGSGTGDWAGRFDKEYVRTLTEHYRPFWKLGIGVDVIESLSDFKPYRLVVAPMLFMLKPGVAARLEAFVEGGGTLVLTYLSGIVNETNIVFRGGWPGAGCASWPASGRRRSTRCCQPPASGSWRRPATRSGSPASTRCASTASASTPRARPCSRPTSATSTPGCPR